MVCRAVQYLRMASTLEPKLTSQAGLRVCVCLFERQKAGKLQLEKQAGQQEMKSTLSAPGVGLEAGPDCWPPMIGQSLGFGPGLRGLQGSPSKEGVTALLGT